MARDEKSLADLLMHGLKDMYYAEGKIRKALPKMIAAAQDDELRDGLEAHLTETGDQIGMLEQAFTLLGEKPKGEKCDAIEGILKEGESLLEDFAGTAAGDAAIIFSCQAVEHYEIARYGSLRAYAELLGHDDVAGLMSQILDQEAEADDLLSRVAEDRANPMAAGEDGDEDGPAAKGRDGRGSAGKAAKGKVAADGSAATKAGAEKGAGKAEGKAAADKPAADKAHADKASADKAAGKARADKADTDRSKAKSGKR